MSNFRTLILLVPALLLPLTAHSHMLNMYDVDRVAELRLADGFVELRMQFGYKEFPGMNLRLAMDRDADDSVSDAEAAAFGSVFIDSVATGIVLTANGERLELPPIREPLAEMYDSRKIIPLHLDLTVELSAPLQVKPGENAELNLTLNSSGDWPHQGRLIVAVVAGRALAVESISLPDSAPSGPEQLLRLSLTMSRRTDEEQKDAFLTGESEWRIVRYGQAYFFPAAMLASVTGNPQNGKQAKPVRNDSLTDDHSAGLRDRVREYLEEGRGGLAALWLILAAAFAYGAVHALAPGHAKTLTAAYLVGSSHGWSHALALAGVVTATHTGSILILAVITRLAWGDGVGLQTQAVLGIVSGLIVLALGIQRLRGGGAQANVHEHGHSHDHDHPHDQDHDHGHKHHQPPDISGSGYRQILWLGFAGGLAPCPGAIWVYFLALGFGRPGLGVLLIISMSLGLALVLLAVGLATIYLRGVMDSGGGGQERPELWHLVLDRLRTSLPALAGTGLVLIGTYLIWNGLARIGLV